MQQLINILYGWKCVIRKIVSSLHSTCLYCQGLYRVSSSESVNRANDRWKIVALITLYRQFIQLEHLGLSYTTQLISRLRGTSCRVVKRGCNFSAVSCRVSVSLHLHCNLKRWLLIIFKNRALKWSHVMKFAYIEIVLHPFIL